MFVFNQKGFSLVEMIVAVSVVAVVSTIVLPKLWDFAEKSKILQAITTMDTIRTAQNVYFLQQDQYASITDLNIDTNTVEENFDLSFNEADFSVTATRKGSSSFSGCKLTMNKDGNVSSLDGKYSHLLVNA